MLTQAFPDRINLFRRDRKMTMGDHLCYDPSDWHSYVRADLFKELEAEVARMRMILASLDAYARGEPSQPPVTGVEKRNIDTGDAR
jgi:hypothetical protein